MWQTTWRSLRARASATVVLSAALLFTPAVSSAVTDALDPSDPHIAGPVTVGYRDHEFGTRVYPIPTAEKPQSKLWWHDDTWWGCLWDPVADTYRIHRLDTTTQTWISVGPNADSRSNTIVDVLWDGLYLYILSHEFDRSGSVMLWSYTYSAGPGTYALRTGFPVTVDDVGPEAATIAKDTTGKLWVTWEESDDIMVTCSTTNDLTWRTPFRLPVQGADVSSDDVSVVTSFAGKIGILWSNQSDDKVYFATHVDGQSDTSWEAREEALVDPGLSVADDHLNVAVDGDVVYAVTKTSLSLETDPGIYLIRRDAAGTWTRYVVALKSDDYTRPCVLIDDENDEIHVFATCSDGADAIRRKTSSLDNIVFPAGLGEVFIQSDSDPDINDPTSTKQNVNGTTNLLVLACDYKTDHYLHNYVDLPGASGDIAVAPASYDFGGVTVDSSATQVFEVRNDGVIDLSVTSMSIVGADPADFAIDSGGSAVVLSPGATHNVTVRFTPTGAGPRSAALRILSDDPDAATLDVDLSGVAVEPDITVTPTALDYTTVAVGQRVARGVQLRNDGNADLDVLTTTVVGADSLEFSIDTPAAPVLLAPGESHSFILSFNPLTPGAKSATLRITSNDPDETTVDAALSGMATGPDVATTPSAYDYGSLRTGRDSTTTVEIRNEGNANLDVTGVSLVGPDPALFTIDSGGGAFAVAPGDTHDVVVRFHPDTPGSKSAMLRIVSNDLDEDVVDVTLTGTGLEPDIVAAPATHDYGGVLVGQDATHVFSIRNTGNTDLDVTSTTLVGADSTQFTIDSGGGPFVVAPGDSSVLTLRFSPDSLGVRNVALRLISDDPDEAVVDVHVTGVGVLPDITLTPSMHDYGTVVVGDSLLRTFEVSNPGSADLHVAATIVVGADSTLFTVDSGGGAFTLTPGAVRDLVVAFRPDSSGARNATLRILSDAPDAAQLDAAMTGVGLQPVIVVTPSQLDYGSVLVGESVPLQLEVYNDGTADLDVTATTVVGADSTHFSIDGGNAPFVLAPGDSTTLDVQFGPTSPGTQAATLRIASNDPDRALVDVALTGMGTLPDITLAPEVHDYGSVTVGDSLMHTFAVRNDGSADLNVASITIAGTDSTTFTIGSGAGAFALAPGDTHHVVVRFAPDSHGIHGAALRIESDDPDEGIADVALSGTGIAPDLAVSPASYDYGGIWVGASAAHTFHVHNLGNTDLNVTSASIVGADSTLFSIDSGGAPFLVVSGDSSALVVRFDPDSLGSRSATLRITSDDPHDASLDLGLAGTGVLPDITLTPQTHDYGSVVVGDSLLQIFEIRNDGSADLSIASTAIVGTDSTHFAIELGSGAFTLAPGDTHDVVVSFQPDSSGVRGAALRIMSDDPDISVLDAALSGIGVRPRIVVTPRAVDFDSLRAGESATRSIDVHNDGTADLHVTSMTFAGADSTDFAFDSGGAPIVVAPDSTHQIVVRFAPSDAGTRSALLQITSDDPDSSVVAVALSGSGLMPKLVVAPPAHDYGGIRVGQDTAQAFRVSNAGNIDLDVTTTTLAGSDSTSFTIDMGSAPFSVAPGDTHDVVVLFVPDSLGARGTTLRVLSNDPFADSLGVALSGTGIAPDIAITPPTHDYGPVVVGQSAAQSFQIQNVGTDDLSVVSTVLTGPDSTLFSIDSGGGAFVLTPGGSRDVVVRFTADSTGTRTATLRVESDDPDPGVLDVTLSGIGVEPEIDVAPVTYDYGDVVRGQSATQSFRVRNDGTSNLNVSVTTFFGADSTMFSIDAGGAPFVVGPGDSNEVFVRFAPDSLGGVEARLRIESDDQDEGSLDIALLGTGVEPDIAVTPPTHAYGDVVLDASVTQTFEVRNDGTSNLDVTSMTVAGADSALFTIESGAGSFSLSPDSSRALVVRFDASTLGLRNAALRIISNDPDANPFDVVLSANVVRPSEPEIVVTPASHDFGETRVGIGVIRAFEVRNDGAPDLNVASTTIVGADSTSFGIQAGGGSFTLAAGEIRTIEVRFEPSSSGSKSATLSLSSDDPDEASFDAPMTGTGVAPDVALTPSSHDYGAVLWGSSVTQAFVVRNDGDADLNVAATSVVGADSTRFVIDAGGGASSVAPGDSHTVVVRFQPDSLGAYGAALRIASDDPDAGIVQAALSGVGVAPEIAVAPTSFDYGAIWLGQDSTQAFELWNEGTADLEVTSTVFVGSDSSAFLIDAGGAPFTVAPGDTHSILVRFAPTTAGSLQASLEIASSDPVTPIVDVALTGAGVQPVLSVVPSVHDFGAVLVGTSTTQAFWVHNDGTASLGVTSTALVGADSTLFTIDSGSGPFTVAPGDSHDVVVRFSPDSLGAESAVLRIVSDDPDQPELDVPLTGSGTVPIEAQIVVTPTSFDFGAVLETSTASYSFEIRNDGNGELEILSTTLVGPDAASFKILSGGGAQSVAPGETHAIALRFHPAVPGSRIATLRISSNDPGDDPVDITLTGIGTPRPSRTTKHLLEEITAGFTVHALEVATTKVEPDDAADRFVAAVVVDEVRAVTNVTGMGLTWARLPHVGTSAEGIHVEVWFATGMPKHGSVTATFSETARNALIAVIGHSDGDVPLLPSEGLPSGGDRDAIAEPEADGNVRRDPYVILLEVAERALVDAIAARTREDSPTTDNVPRETSLEIASRHGAPVIVAATPVTTQARVTVHDVRGRLIRTLWTGALPAGRHRFTWNDAGPRTASGIYFIRAEIGAKLLTRKLLLVH